MSAEDIVIKNVICDRNYRQGISVISARNLLIENTIMRDTAGTAPSAGIDFEPNHASEELVNCIMHNCIWENNAGCGRTENRKKSRVSRRCRCAIPTGC